MKLLYLRKEIDENLRHIPEWIDTKSVLHKRVWDTIEYCHEVLFILITDKILSEKSIIRITDKFEEYILEIVDVIEPQLHIILMAYFISVLEYLLWICLENEEYEAATNVRNFNDLYFQQNISDVNE